MKSLFSLLAASSLPALAAAPAAILPPIEIPAAFRDAEPDAFVGKTAEPAEHLGHGQWWKLFRDATLDDLETRALAANQDLRAAAARVEQARAAAGLARSNFWPQIAANGLVTREQGSSTTENVPPDSLTTTYRAPLSVAWEVDLFGRVRQLTAGARAEAEAGAAQFESLRLVLTSEVAVSYFSLRTLDRELVLLRDTVGLRRRARELVASRAANGVASQLDLARADTEWAATEAEVAALASRRAALQNALAVLLGAPAPLFALAELSTVEPLTLPEIPAGLPAALLERRPDIAAAEHALAAASARIGVAKTAFFPAISLTGAAGQASGELESLFKPDSRIWSIGPSVYLPVFQGGRNRANLARSRAAYDESVAVYRQRVLLAFREVQEALSSARLLAEQAAAQERALLAARRAATLAQARYDAGFVSYLEVIDAQRSALATERAAAQLAAHRSHVAVALVKALGGGWHRPDVVVAK